MPRLYEDVHCPECGAFVDQLPFGGRPVVLECELCGVSFEHPIEENEEDDLEYDDYETLDDSY